LGASRALTVRGQLAASRIPPASRACSGAGAPACGRTGPRVRQAEAELREQKQRLFRLLAAIEQKGMDDLIEQQYDRANERYLALTA
jgi:hypothetical protein